MRFIVEREKSERGKDGKEEGWCRKDKYQVLRYPGTYYQSSVSVLRLVREEGN